MANISHHRFCFDAVTLDDGAVAFRCSQDANTWPWLALPPEDPIVVQMVNYFVSVEAGLARGSHDPTKWSALTQTDWVCDDLSSGHATHGIAEASPGDKASHYSLTLFSAKGTLVYRMRGTGVIFKTRDFEQWRARGKSRQSVLETVESFQCVPADSVGVQSQIESFLSPLETPEALATQALITPQNGMPPGHPYLDGSGDHVNSTHIADIGRQFARLRLSDPSLSFCGGKMRFMHYVEFGRLIHVQQVTSGDEGREFALQISQNGRPCACMSLFLDRA